jgi:transcriptional regulator with XRE-family HTH domain/alpha-ketoglutarate-dependent taurine dioxygenase
VPVNEDAPVVPESDASSTLNQLGVRLKELRSEKRMTLTDLSQRSQVSVGMLSHIERGQTSPSLKTLERLRLALEVPLAHFFAEDVPQSDERGIVTRAVDRRTLNFQKLGLTKELLSPANRSGLELLMLVVEPGGGSGGEPWTRQGEKGGMGCSGHLRTGDRWTELHLARGRQLPVRQQQAPFLPEPRHRKSACAVDHQVGRARLEPGLPGTSFTLRIMNTPHGMPTARRAFGAEIDLGPLSKGVSAEAIDRIRDAVIDHGYVVLRDQRFTDGALMDFASHFGTIEQRVIKYSTVGPSRNQRPSLWHHHSHCIDQLDDWIVYYTPAVPDQGGATEFFDARGWFDLLAPSDQAWARQQSVRHNYECVAHTGIDPVAQPEWHPMVTARRSHRGTQEAVYWGAHAQELETSAQATSDGSDPSPLQRILALASDPLLCQMPAPRPHDVVIWDMHMVAHRGWHWSDPSLRVIHEVVVKRVAP